MAVLTEHPRVRARVKCERKTLQEYDADDADEEDAPSTNPITKYIERNPVLNGKYVTSRIVSNTQYKRAHGTLKRSFDSIATKIARGQCLDQNFCFSELQIDDSDDYTCGEKLLDDLESLGSITLEVQYIKNLQMVPSKPKRIDKERGDVGPIAEKALKGKAVTHQAGFGAAVNRSYTTSAHHTHYDHVDPGKIPFAIFNFKYRSKAALKSLLIMPRSPSPLPLEDRDVNTLTFEESQELIRRMREQKTTSRNFKQEHGVKREHSAVRESGEDDDEVSFVSEIKRPRYNITVNPNGVETIDFT